MIPKYPEFKSLEIENKTVITRHLRATTREICELTLGNLFIWQNFDRPQATCIHGNVCIQINPFNEAPYFLEPLGREKLRETTEILFNHSQRLSRVSKGFINALKEFGYKFTPLRNHFDYIYLRTDLAELKGRKYDGKRNHIKHFQRVHPSYEYVTLKPEMKAEALSLFEKWFTFREESKYFPKLAHTAQKDAITTAFDLFSALHLIGGALYVDNDLKGFALGSKLNPATASVHFMYGDPSLPGIAQILNWEAANKTFSDFKYLDLEQDLGIPGLRTAKLSYHPFKLEEKFEVSQ